MEIFLAPLNKYKWRCDFNRLDRGFIDIPECCMKWVNFVKRSVFACVLSGECLVGSAFAFSSTRKWCVRWSSRRRIIISTELEICEEY